MQPRPYVGLISQQLAANSSKRRVQYVSNDRSIHTRLHYQQLEAKQASTMQEKARQRRKSGKPKNQLRPPRNQEMVSMIQNAGFLGMTMPSAGDGHLLGVEKNFRTLSEKLERLEHEGMLSPSVANIVNPAKVGNQVSPSDDTVF